LFHDTGTVKNQSTACCKDRLGSLREIPRKRLHGGIVAHQQAVEADLCPDNLRNDLAGGRGRIVWIDRRIDDMARHRHRQVVQGSERYEVVFAKISERSIILRQFVMAVDKCSPVAGYVLHHRQKTSSL